MLYMVNEKIMTKLQDFVKNGGILISSYFTGMVNETDLLYIGGSRRPPHAAGRARRSPGGTHEERIIFFIH